MTAAPVLTLIVYGQPGVAGSKRQVPIYKGKGDEKRLIGVRVAPDDQGEGRPNATWRSAIVDAAMAAIADSGHAALFPLDEALEVTMVFTVRKPATASKTARTFPDRRPDLLKYTRATEDALKDAGVYVDDARIVRYRDHGKVYPREDPNSLELPGVLIRVWRMHDLAGWQRDAITTAAAVPGLFDEVTP